jgi:hypothetical protein
MRKWLILLTVACTDMNVRLGQSHGCAELPTWPVPPPQSARNCGCPITTHPFHLAHLSSTLYTVILKQKMTIITSHYGIQNVTGYSKRISISKI